jgi:hypothetical protein
MLYARANQLEGEDWLLATQEDWLKFIKCSKNRMKKLVGYYALHVSKSGGMYTSHGMNILISFSEVQDP